MADDRRADVRCVLSDDERERACEQEVRGHRVCGWTRPWWAVLPAETREGVLHWGMPTIIDQICRTSPVPWPPGTRVVFRRPATSLSLEQADDPVDVPVIDRVPRGWKSTGLWDVGDGARAAEQTRAPVQAQEDGSRGPLSTMPVLPPPAQPAFRQARR